MFLLEEAGGRGMDRMQACMGEMIRVGLRLWEDEDR